MEFTGKIIAVCEAKSGNGNNGAWASQDYVVENNQGQYPERMVFNIFGADKIAQAGIKYGDNVIVHFSMNAREYQGRWYGENRAWRVDKVHVQKGGLQTQQTPQQTQLYAPPPQQGYAPQAVPTYAPQASQGYAPQADPEHLPF